MNDFIKLIFDFFNEFLMFHRSEMTNVFFSINLEKFFECLIFSEFGNTIVSEEELLTKLVNSKNFEFTLLCVPTDTSISPFCLASDSFSRQVSFLFDFAKDKFVMNLFLFNFFLIKIIFFKVNSLTFWILPQIILFFGGLLVFLLIKTNDMNLKIWDLTLKILLIAIFYQFILLYLYLNFFNLGLELKVGLGGTFKVPFNFFLAKLLSFLIILILLFISTYFLKRFYFKTLFLIKPELCSLTLFLGFGSGMVFLQNDLFSIFLYLEIVSFCIYGFLFLQQRSNSQLHGLIRYVLFSLWMASFYILGVALYLSWTNFSTNLSYFFDNDNLLNEVATTRPDYKLSMSHGIINFEITLSILCFLFYFLFKLGAGPFYTWVIEVYNSCSTGVLLIVSVIPKLVYTPILFFLLFFNFINYYAYWSSILFIIGVATTVIGSMGILYTDKLKEIYAWSSIIHTGNVLIILSCVTQATLAFCFFYLVSYVIISVGFVSIIVSL
jgi:NADH:ubiquinone oxidoreductase subunit 2 (subunit N)